MNKFQQLLLCIGLIFTPCIGSAQSGVAVQHFELPSGYNTLHYKIAGDFCQQNHLYGDGVCDRGCPLPDSDCTEVEAYISSVSSDGDACALNALHSDGICDVNCLRFDVDCDSDDVRAPLESRDFCTENGLYGDGVCDTHCPEVDSSDCTIVSATVIDADIDSIVTELVVDEAIIENQDSLEEQGDNSLQFVPDVSRFTWFFFDIFRK